MKRLRFPTVALVLLCAWLPHAQASTHAAERASAAQPLAIGDTFTLDSKVLGETRRINVWRPPVDAAKPDAPLPVLYLLDGGLGEDFLHVAGLMQVSIANGTLRPFLLARTGEPTIPQIFVGGTHVGGCTATFAAHADGSLDRLLDRHGVPHGDGVCRGVLALDMAEGTLHLFRAHVFRAMDDDLALLGLVVHPGIKAAQHQGRAVLWTYDVITDTHQARTGAQRAHRIAHALAPRGTTAFAVRHPGAQQQVMRAQIDNEEPLLTAGPGHVRDGEHARNLAVGAGARDRRRERCFVQAPFQPARLEQLVIAIRQRRSAGQHRGPEQPCVHPHPLVQRGKAADHAGASACC